MSAIDLDHRLTALYFRYIAVLTVALLAGACTSLTEIRTNHDPAGVSLSRDLIHESNPSLDCSHANFTETNRRFSIENYDEFSAGYVEFDDEGWLYRPSDPSGPNQIQAVESRLKFELKQHPGDEFLVVAFIHGWHHNANASDCNVAEFRSMLKIMDQRYSIPSHKRRIFGVYVGWRGESLPYGYLSATTVLDRRNAASRVAKGDIRRLFAGLRKIQIDASADPDPTDASKPFEEHMRTVVIGHSFGGLVAFEALSPALINELTLTRPEPPDCVPVVSRTGSTSSSSKKSASFGRAGTPNPPIFPDMLILINPAFEGTRFESIHALGAPVPGCRYPAFVDHRPKVLVVTSENDQWTGPNFTAGRWLLTRLEAYPPAGKGQEEPERDANLHAPGFTTRYETHELKLVGGEPIASLLPTLYDNQLKLEPCSPVWVVRASSDIIYGHNGFLYPGMERSNKEGPPYLLNWIIGLHTQWDDKAKFMGKQDDCAKPQAF